MMAFGFVSSIHFILFTVSEVLQLEISPELQSWSLPLEEAEIYDFL